MAVLSRVYISQQLSLQPILVRTIKKKRNGHTKHTNKKINYRKIDEDGKIEQGQQLHAF